MFKKKQPKIVNIAMGVSGDFIFTFGLGKDGKVYSWNAQTASWALHIVMPPKEPADAN